MTDDSPSSAERRNKRLGGSSASRPPSWPLMLILLAVPGPLFAQDGTDAVVRELRARFELTPPADADGGAGSLTSPQPADIKIAGSAVYAVEALGAFYARRGYRPAWVNAEGPRSSVSELVEAVRGAHREGLNPLDYHLVQIEQALAESRDRPDGEPPPDPADLVDLELLASDAFMVYGSHLLSGRVNPESIHSEWVANRRGADFAAVLDTALVGSRIRETLERLAPPQSSYARLRAALAAYRALEARGGWPSVPDGPSLKMGDRSERVASIRGRLAAEGRLATMVGDHDATAPTAGDDDDLFDSDLDAAVRAFQGRHGLGPDGVVGSGTVAAMNVPIEERIEQIELNLERWRWLPEHLGARHLIVNIAAYSLDVVDRDSTALTMRVIVGRPYRRTPVFSDTITYLVFNPYWNVPRDLAVLDKLPLIKGDPGYLAAQKIRVYSSWEAGAPEVDPSTVDWQTISPKSFKYRLVQEPGPQNALGRVKFMFPNKFNVYLHDTPGRELFSREQRDFSSGCIRLEKPLQLATYLLADNPSWSSRGAVEAAIATGREQTVTLRRPIPVHLLYWTAWSSDDGSVSFRADIYDRDEAVLVALGTRPGE